VYGTEKAIVELEKIETLPSLQNYHLLFSTKAEFYLQMNQHTKAAEYLEKAIQLSSQNAEIDLLKKKLQLCTQK
jgi:predicted RNA polymerase sigma factor